MVSDWSFKVAIRGAHGDSQIVKSAILPHECLQFVYVTGAQGHGLGGLITGIPETTATRLKQTHENHPTSLGIALPLEEQYNDSPGKIFRGNPRENRKKKSRRLEQSKNKINIEMRTRPKMDTHKNNWDESTDSTLQTFWIGLVIVETWTPLHHRNTTPPPTSPPRPPT